MAHPTVELMGATYPNVPIVELPVSGGGLARFSDATEYEVVHGEFNTGSTTGTVKSFSVPYLGTGFPIALSIYAKDGMRKSGSTFSDTIQKYAVGCFTAVKADMTLTPTYTTSGVNNQFAVVSTYKSNATDSTTYARAGAADAQMLNSETATNSNSTCVRMSSATQGSYYVASNGFGLLANIDYEYLIVYKN